ncbi:alanine:cation symporter family protein [Fusobacterium perfoetens]|uniref:alanine/glycine:cation symporter family protein n=1 Tax=Fusobacterium perfoetens TaxID=852 RepID=UPI001F172A2A|nr:alanine/glycine:cation symporter family protein [Fusobacterium perfoetens]MCF2626120.1 alanine:cation symporter family protein [Fusobacterium perfoetens]
MNFFSSIVDFVNGIIWGKNIIVVMLVGTGIFFTLSMKFMQIRLLKDMAGLLIRNTKDSESGISSFQAFCVSTATRVGAGNLVGVVAALSVGGAGSVFWMWIVAIFGAATAFVEATLALLFREKDKRGDYVGGAAYYIQKGLNKRWLGVIFVVFAMICWGGVLQVISNSVTESFHVAFGIDAKIMSGILAVLAAGVIFGRKDKIVRVLEKMVPFMAFAYLILVAFILVKNITLIPDVFKRIFEEAFGIRQAIGGSFGAVVMEGVKRGLFSNEAGTGSAPSAAAAAEVDHPAKQGLIQALGVYVDTLIICTATAFVVLVTNEKITAGLGGMTLLQEAFRYHVGNWGVIFIAFVLFLFAFSTALGITYYAKPNLIFIADKDWLQTAFKIFACCMLFYGGMKQAFLVWALADLGLGLMAIVNISAIIPLRKYAFDSLKDYEKKLKEDKK